MLRMPARPARMRGVAAAYPAGLRLVAQLLRMRARPLGEVAAGVRLLQMQAQRVVIQPALRAVIAVVARPSHRLVAVRARGVALLQQVAHT